MRPHGIMFHHFWDSTHPRGQGAMSAEDLVNMIQFVGPKRILPARQWAERAAAGSLRKGDLCLTFDDNLKCQYDVAVPVLREFGLTAFFFVYTSVLRGNVERLEVYRHFRTTEFEQMDDFYDAFAAAVRTSPYKAEVEQGLADFDPRTYLAGFPFYTDADRTFRYVRDGVLGPAKYFAVMDRMIAKAGLDIAAIGRELWMDVGHVRELHDEGHVIGLHSDTHPTRVADLPFELQEMEYFTNAEQLTDLLGEPPTTMSHPCNSYNERTLRVLRSLGVTVGFRANMQLPADGSACTELEWPREDHANLLKAMAA